MTNINKTVLYTGITNDLKSRLYWHKNSNDGNNHFTTKYKCFYLVYYENFQDVEQSIAREKQIKGYSRLKKENLINTFNSGWSFLNETIE